MPNHRQWKNAEGILSHRQWEFTHTHTPRVIGSGNSHTLGGGLRPRGLRPRGLRPRGLRCRLVRRCKFAKHILSPLSHLRPLGTS